MLTTIKSRRGVTLAEIMVAIALVAIMCTMVVSFTMLMAERTRGNQISDTMRQDCQKIEAAVEGWLNAMNKEGASVDATTGEERTASVVAKNEGVSYTLQFSYNTLTGTLPSAGESEGNDLTVRTEAVAKVEFAVMTKGSDYLVFCYVTCKNPETQESVEYTFCINPRVGDSI